MNLLIFILILVFPIEFIEYYASFLTTNKALVTTINKFYVKSQEDLITIFCYNC